MTLKARVVQIVRDLVPPQRPVKLESAFTSDLKIDTDDLSFLLVPRIEKEFGIHPLRGMASGPHGWRLGAPCRGALPTGPRF
jgi:hypothetical protein